MSTTAEIEPRTYFSSLDNALADFAPPFETIPRIREVASDLRYAHVYIPESRAHIGLESGDGGAPIAYIFPTLIALHPRDGVSSFVELPHDPDVTDDAPEASTPGRSASRVASRTSTPATPATCGRCFLTLPATGRCDACD